MHYLERISCVAKIYGDKKLYGKVIDYLLLSTVLCKMYVVRAAENTRQAVTKEFSEIKVDVGCGNVLVYKHVCFDYAGFALYRKDKRVIGINNLMLISVTENRKRSSHCGD